MQVFFLILPQTPIPSNVQPVNQSVCKDNIQCNLLILFCLHEVDYYNFESFSSIKHFKLAIFNGKILCKHKVKKKNQMVQSMKH